MKQHICLLIISSALVLFACNPEAERNVKTEGQSSSADSLSLPSNQTIANTSEQDLRNNCVRRQAEPVIQKRDYPQTIFVLQPDSLTAIESVTFENRDKLVIRNWGCEYYVLTFRFETSKFQQDTTNLEYWFKAANKLMTGMLSGLDAPMNIKRGLVFLDNYILRDEKNKFKNLKLGDEIDFNEGEIRSFITVDRIERIAEKKFAVTISFATGPL